MTAKRPLRSRFWFYKPQWDWDWHWIKAWAWKITYTGGDDYDWHTRVWGFPFTGQIVIATRHCTGTGKCREEVEEHGLTDWPIDRQTYDDLRLRDRLGDR